MIKVMVNGCTGTMGKILVNLIQEDDCLKFVCGVSRSACEGLTYKCYDSMNSVTEDVDVIIDFSHHSTLDDMLEYALKTKTALVIATTGYSDEALNKINEASKQIPILLSYNMSLGINVLLKLVKEAAKSLSDFDIEIVERHHNRKVDAPSGTAIMISNAIKEVLPHLENNHGRQGHTGKRNKNELGIHALRCGTIVGEHDILFAGNQERLELKHAAQSNTIFGNGAIAAAKFIVNQKPGYYTMCDILD